MYARIRPPHRTTLPYLKEVEQHISVFWSVLKILIVIFVAAGLLETTEVAVKQLSSKTYRNQEMFFTSHHMGYGQR